MTNKQVASILEEVGHLLEFKGENPFKTKAYFKAAQSIDALSEDLRLFVQAKRLLEIDGIGAALAEKITTLVETGSMPYYEELKNSFPTSLLDLLRIRGLGPKKIKLFYDHLAINSLEKLELACMNCSLASLPSMGAKGVANILASLEEHKLYAGLHHYADAHLLAEEILDWLRGHPDILRLSLTGSLRRSLEVVDEIELLGSTSRAEEVMADFIQYPELLRVISHGLAESSILIQGDLPCTLRLVADAQFASALHHFTGSQDYTEALRQRALVQGYEINVHGLNPLRAEISPVRIRTEKDLFDALELEEIPAELRENLGEIQAAEKGVLPQLVEWTDLKGCFHNHTTASDGRNTLREMAEAAASVGLAYFGIADHSKSSVQAHGLSEERLLEQVSAIKKLNIELEEIELFSGVECDILKDGSLDYADSILAQLDYVVASIHSSFTLTEKEMTNRICAAMENPHVTMIGHLSGRLLLQRQPYRLDVPYILKSAAKTGTWIELNSSPYRLDMDWRWWKLARDLGVKCVINPDAHSVGKIGTIKLGTQIARKGWLRKEDVINCLSLDQMCLALGVKRKLVL